MLYNKLSENYLKDILSHTPRNNILDFIKNVNLYDKL